MSDEPSEETPEQRVEKRAVWARTDVMELLAWARQDQKELDARLLIRHAQQTGHNRSVAYRRAAAWITGRRERS